MVLHGYPKVLSLQTFIQKVEGLDLPFPMILGPSAAFSEFFGGLLLLVGLFTRISAFLIAVTMGVAVVFVHLENGYWSSDKGYEYPLTLGLVALSLVLSGAGPWSLDRRFRGK